MTLVLLLLNLGLCLLCTGYVAKAANVVKRAVFSVSAFLFVYLAVSGAAFFFDIFHVNGVLAATALAEAVILGWNRWVKRRTPVPLDGNIRPYAILLALAVLGLLLSGENFGYFGMGQDQGVYQVKAIELMQGNTRRVSEPREYELLETQEQRDLFVEKIQGLDGFDNLARFEAEASALPGVQTPSDNAAAAIFHGIPTFPAMLALTGRVAGMDNMAWSQTLFYLLTLFVIWFAAEELGLNRLLCTLACLMYLLSPEVVWVSKSTLSEGFHALIMAWFIYLLVNRTHPERRWYSALMVAAFACWHVSIYAMIPMFIVLYMLMYARTHDRQYIRAGLISAAGFMLGFTMMVVVAPRYSLANTYRLTSVFAEHPGVIWPLMMACAAVAALLLLIIRRFDLRRPAEALFSGRAGVWLLRALLAASLLLTAWQTARSAAALGSMRQALQQNGLMNYVWMTGVVVLPVLLLRIWCKPEIILRNELTLGMGFVFFYTVLLYAGVLKPQIDYCYYYGRYFVPYIPVAALVAAYAFRDVGRRSLKAVTALMVAAMLPFDGTLYLHKDDTFCSYEELASVGQCVDRDSTAVVFAGRNTACLGYFPYRSLYGVDGYFLEEDINAQLQWLSRRYAHVYILHDTGDGSFDQPEDTSIAARIVHRNYMDDNRSYRIAPCPFPLWFTQCEQTLTLYQYDTIRYYQYESANLNGQYMLNGFDAKGRRHLQQNGISFGPYITLEPGTYELVIRGERLSAACAYVTSDSGTVTIDCRLLAQEEGQILLAFTLEERSENIEFCVVNPSEQDVILDSMTLRNTSEN